MNKLVINRNENLYGPSPKCMNAIKNFKKDHAYLYLDGSYQSILGSVLAKKYKLNENQIIVCYGGEDFLKTAFNELSSSDSILTHEYCFGYYTNYALHRNIPINFFKMQEKNDSFSFDLKDCIEKCNSLRPNLLILTSPNNPTGSTISFSELEFVLKNISKEILVIFDEVYLGFDYSYKDPNYAKLLEDYPNLALLRSFSKYYALAGLRIAYALCGRKAIELLRYRKPYTGISRILEEVAIAALQSDNYYSKIAEKICNDRDWLLTETKKLNHFRFYSSKANFVLFKPNSSIDSILKVELYKEKRVLCKEMQNGYWRFTIGKTSDVKHFYKIINKIDSSIVK